MTTKKRTDIVVAAPLTSKSIEARKVDVKMKAADRAVDAASSAIELLVRGGHLFLDVKRMQAETAKDWEATRRKVEELDATTKAELQKLEAQLKQHKEKTKRLQLVLDVIAQRGDTLPEAYAKGLSAAVENLTREW